MTSEGAVSLGRRGMRGQISFSLREKVPAGRMRATPTAGNSLPSGELRRSLAGRPVSSFTVPRDRTAKPASSPPG